MSGLPSSEYKVEFSVPYETSTLNYLTQYYNGKANSSEASPVAVTAGTTTPNINAALAPGGQISGTVTGASTKAVVAGIQVCAYTDEFFFGRCATTNSSGEYTVSSLISGKYTVEFSVPSETSTLNYLTQYYSGKANFWEASPVSVTAGTATPNINAALPAGGQVSGKVTDATTKAAVAGIQVCAYTGEFFIARCATTNASGEYAVSGLTSGEYKVEFSVPSETSTLNYLTQYYNGKANSSEASPVAVTAGTTTPNINAALAPGGQISGTVTNASTKATVAGIQVCAFSSSAGSCATTNSSGEYTVPRLGTGEYQVDFVSSSDNYLTQYYNGKSNFSEASPVSVTAGLTTPNINAALQPGGQISGTVTDASTKAALSGIEVCADTSEFVSVRCTTTNAGGEYTIPGLNTGEYKVEFTPTSGNYLTQYYNGKSSFAEASPVSVTAGVTTPSINAALATGGQISGKVTNASTKAAAAGIEVCAFSSSAEGCVLTNLSGEYTIPGLGTGEYTVDYTSGSGKYLTQYYNGKSNFAEANPVPVTAGVITANINAALQPGGQISGTVTDAGTKAALSGIEVCADTSEFVSARCTTTNASGEYAILGLSTGEYKVEFTPGSSSYLTQYYNGKSKFSEASPVSVTAGISTPNINAALQLGGQISGTVTDASTKAAVSNIEVCAFTSGSVVRCAITNASGEYTIPGLSTGEYTVEFTPTSGNYLTQYYNGKAALSEASPVSVTAGITTPNINAALQPGGQISGAVTDASTKAAVSGIEVCAYTSEFVFVRCVTTNASGEYTIPGLSTGEYKVEFTSGSNSYTAQYYNGKSNFSEASPVSVTAGLTTPNINAALQPGGQISGKVTDASTKAAVSSIEVCASTSGSVLRCAITNASGEYTISGLTSGSYTVEFAPPFVNGANYITQYYDGKSKLSEASPVSVTAGITTPNINAALQPGGQISGTVTDASTKAAVSGIEVCASTSEFVFVRCVTTNASGEYTIAGLSTGEYKIEFASGSSSYITQYYNGKSTFAEASPVSVTAGVTTPNINAALQPGGQISGKVTDASTKAAVSGIEVCASTSEFVFVSCATTSASGEYAIPGLSTGEYKVEFSPPFENSSFNYLTQYYNGKSTFAEAGVVSVTAGITTPNINAALAPGGEISGKVTDASTKGALSGIRVCATSELFLQRCVTTNASGEYTIAGLSTGGYKVEFTSVSSSYIAQYYNGKTNSSEATPVAVTAGTTTPSINAALAPGGQISGKVTDASTKAAVAGIDVCASTSEFVFVSCATTNASGEYTISSLGVGQYKVEFSVPSESSLNYITQYYNGKSKFSEASSVSVTVGVTTPNINAALEPGGQITGTVTAASTKGTLAGIRVCASTSESLFVRCATTNSTGEYALTSLASGEYKIEFSVPLENNSLNYITQYYSGKSKLSEASAVSVIAGTTTPKINAALAPGGEISGKVTAALTTAVVPGIRVCVSALGSVVHCARTNSSGEYTVSSLASGEYTVSFTSLGTYVTQYYNGKVNSSEANPVSVTVGTTTPSINAALQLTEVTAPTVVTKAASAITESGATLNASVNPDGSEVSECEFEYGTTTAYGLTVPCSKLPGAGTSPVEVSAAAVLLAANTEYHFRISAKNAIATSKGTDLTFKTPAALTAPTVVTKAASAITESGATLNASVNPDGSEVSECEFEYGTTTAYGLTVPCSKLPGAGTSPVEVSAAAVLLAANTEYHFRISAKNAIATSKGTDLTFKTPAALTAPTVVTKAASAITESGATLNASVNPDGSEVSECEFEYGTTTAYGLTVPCSKLPGAGTSPVEVSAAAVLLAANTEYHFRISAKNAIATSKGTDLTFKTPAALTAPTVVTKAASAITESGATLNASVNPDGSEVSECEFEYGTTTAYGLTVPCSKLPGAGTSPVEVSAAAVLLAANTEYHFRISAKNAIATSKGTDLTFKTPAALTAPTVVTKAASAITESGATLNASVNPDGSEVSECEFEYGTTTAYGLTVPCSKLPGAGTSPVEVSAAAVLLAANTEYHFRISAKNAIATSKGTDLTFKTPAALTAPTVVTKAASAITESGATLNASVNPDGSEVSECEFEYGTTTAYGLTVPCSKLPGAGTSPVEVSAAAVLLAANTEYHFRISAKNAIATSKGTDLTFKTPAALTAPTVVTKAASAITESGATLNASVNPDGSEVSECEFEYGTTTAYGLTVPCSKLPGAGTSPVEVSAAAVLLAANTEYHFRISAKNAIATSKGTDLTFKTPAALTAPTVVTKAASAITESGATLNASVNPDGSEVSECEFEYGTTTAYGLTVPCSKLPGAGTSPVEVSAAAVLLAANTEYHFRISAKNAIATSKGTDLTFKTPAALTAPTVVTKAASAITESGATLNASVNPDGSEVSECEFEYGTTTAYGLTVPCSKLPGAGTSPVEVSAAAVLLAANTEYHFRISAKNAIATSKGTDLTFKTPAALTAPTVVTKAASAITESGATLNASVNPDGSEVSECEFEYGTTTAYGLTVPCSKLPGAGTSPVEVSAAAVLLAANTEYHFRISAKNAIATSKGTDLTFKTPAALTAPTVVTKAASAITESGATLNASVNPDGSEVSECEFEYGTTTAYGLTVPCSKLPGAGTSPVEVSAAAVLLAANTEYHFRISAKNAIATSKGTDLTFKTPAALTAPTVVTKAASAITESGATLNASVNPDGSEVSECEFEYGTTTAYGLTVPCSKLPGAGTSPVEVSAAAVLLAANTEYHFRISAKNAIATSKGTDLTFKTPAALTAPTVVTKAASAITESGATLNASVNPDGSEVSECEFEYGTTTAYGLTVPCSKLPGAGTSPVEVSAAAVLLAANTEYHFRISAKNAIATSKGTDLTFKTPPDPPTVVTIPASSVTQTTATLNATVNPQGGEVSNCEVEYGTTITYGSSVPCSILPGSGSGPVAVSASVSGLTPNTIYHFRVSATNPGGTKKGPDQTFKTPPGPASAGSGGGATKAAAGSGVLGSIAAAPPPPKFAVSGNVAPVSGSVLVKLPGSSIFVSLTAIRQIPFGAIIDATAGKVTVTTVGPHGVIQTITYSEGEFELTQGANGFVVATLVGGDFSVCPTARERTHLARASSKYASRKHVVRKLWSEGHGKYSTKGNYAAGAVLGTRWLTEDLCDGTLIHVVTDHVAVTNLVNHRHLTVRAGRSYLAKAP